MARFRLFGRRKEAPRVAAAAPLTPGYRRAQKRVRQSWQERAEYFATVLGAARFASGVGADACSRCTLQIEKLVDPRGDTWEPVENNNLLADLMRSYRGKTETQRELVRQHAWLEDTIGEALQLVEQDGRRAVWSMRSPLATTWRGDGVLIRDVPGGTERDGTARLLPYEQVRRVWVPNETWPGLANSPLHGVMEDCELYWTTLQKMQRDTSSALIGNGILWTPAEAHTDLARSQSEPGGPARPGTDIERDYYAVAQRAFEDRDAVEANAPLLWHWKHEYGPPQKIDLAKDLDEQSIRYLTVSLEGIARGLNYPQRLLVDDGKDTNHWGMWLYKEDFAKESIAPRMERICWGDITTTFLHPGLRALAAKGLFADDPDMYRVGFDMAPIVVHPDQSQTVLELYKLGIASDTAALEYAGLPGSVAPDREELGRWIIRTNILHESVRAPLEPGQTLPSDAANVIESTPQAAPGIVGPTTAALDTGSRVREPVRVGPMANEAHAWLDT